MRTKTSLEHRVRARQLHAARVHCSAHSYRAHTNNHAGLEDDDIPAPRGAARRSSPREEEHELDFDDDDDFIEHDLEEADARRRRRAAGASAPQGVSSRAYQEAMDLFDMGADDLLQLYERAKAQRQTGEEEGSEEEEEDEDEEDEDEEEEGEDEAAAEKRATRAAQVLVWSASACMGCHGLLASAWQVPTRVCDASINVLHRGRKSRSVGGGGRWRKRASSTQKWSNGPT